MGQKNRKIRESATDKGVGCYIDTNVHSDYAMKRVQMDYDGLTILIYGMRDFG